MRAFLLRSYGSADALRLTQVQKPEPAAGEVLVKVHATSVQPYDWHLMRGQPYIARLMGGGPGLRRPKISILGADVAGTVESVGEGVTAFQPGDEVYGMPKQGGFGEYTCVPAGELVPKPRNLSFSQAAAVPMAANTALIALRDCYPGQNVLINGASGGVGTFAVQIAMALGAKVTAVCGPRNLAMVASLGAEEVIDRTREDFTQRRQRYDLLLDVAGGPSTAACRRALTPKGAHVLVGGPGGRWLSPAGRMLATMLAGPFVSQRVAVADVVRCTDNHRNLTTLTTLLESGQITPVIDRGYPFEQIPDAIRYQEQGRSAGKVVITFGDS
ncbi:NAD(P)-dependent alcohol dehydrogenase [Nonomuraea sp. NPDC055795]